jgi:hypothetical protein
MGILPNKDLKNNSVLIIKNLTLFCYYQLKVGLNGNK